MKLAKCWKKLLQDLGFDPNLDSNQETFEALIQAYSEPHRYYHTLVHIEAMLHHFDNASSLAQYPEEVALAIWFHDAIYDPHSASNELDSAEWAARFMCANSATSDFIARVHQLIMATLHDSDIESPDGKLLVDIDLSILGASAHVYDEFESNVRKEYAWVPESLFKEKRKAILQSFEQRNPLYQTEYFRDKLEAQAKTNLARTIALL